MAVSIIFSQFHPSWPKTEQFVVKIFKRNCNKSWYQWLFGQQLEIPQKFLTESNDTWIANKIITTIISNWCVICMRVHVNIIPQPQSSSGCFTGCSNRHSLWCAHTNEPQHQTCTCSVAWVVQRTRCPCTDRTPPQSSTPYGPHPQTVNMIYL